MSVAFLMGLHDTKKVCCAIRYHLLPVALTHVAASRLVQIPGFEWMQKIPDLMASRCVSRLRPCFAILGADAIMLAVWPTSVCETSILWRRYPVIPIPHAIVSERVLLMRVVLLPRRT